MSDVVILVALLASFVVAACYVEACGRFVRPSGGAANRTP